MTSEVRNIVINLYNPVLAMVIATQDELAQVRKMRDVCVKLLTTG